jgi:peptidoglycan hydrolase-like protein with peptidoglycan-binding domain
MKKHAQKPSIDIGQIVTRLRIFLRRRTKQASQAIQMTRSGRKSTAPVAMATRQRAGRKRTIRVKNIKRLTAIAGAVAVVLVAVILVTTLSGPKPASGDELVAAANNLVGQADTPGMEANNAQPIPTTPPESKVSLAMPVFQPVSIAPGTEAIVVTDLQTRLMELDYMDEDEPGTVYEETTKLAVEHFQAQHELPVTGTVDQQTYDLLMSDQAKYYTITIEAESTDVSELQGRLYELGYLDKDKTTGYFGTDTEAAVMKFQKLNGLSEDGKVGKDTREMLYSEDAKPNMYSYGEQSPEILAYQERLRKLGYLTTDPDGTFGEDTKAAVKLFQESSGLIADGYIGPTTKAALMSDDAQGNALAIGAKGETVQRVQERLKALGYTRKVTGYFGSDTDAAVKNFQSTNKLKVDGKVGAQTMNTLMSDSAKKYKKPSSSGGGSSDNGGGGGSSANISGANVDSFISVAESKIGSKYVRGAKGPNSFDCSGFVYWCLNQVGVNQSYMTSGSWAKSSKYTKIDNMGDMQRGDIIVFKGHVAIYAGSGVMIDASSSNGKVVKRGSTGSWSQRSFICAFRVF